MNRKRMIAGVQGRVVDDPVTGRRVTAEPMEVEDSPFWRRRLKQGDVVDVKPQSKTSSETQSGETPVKSKSKN